jgi:hypothetical protein
MSRLLRSPSRHAKVFVVGGIRLLIAAILLYPLDTVVRAVVPAESAESQESGPSGESESAESEFASAPSAQASRCGRRCYRRESSLPGIVAPSVTVATKCPRSVSIAGHRLSNGLSAPLRC